MLLYDNYKNHLVLMLGILIADELLDADNDLMIAGMLTDEEILAQARPAASDVNVDDDGDDDSVDDSVVLSPPTYEEVVSCVKTIKCYIQSKPDAEKEISMLYDLEDKLESLKDRFLVQKSITDYFA